MDKTNARYYVHNEQVEMPRLDSLAALVEFFILHGIPLDAKINFRGEDITCTTGILKIGHEVYVTLGGADDQG